MNQNISDISGRKKDIIEAAQRVFADYGYKKTSLDDIAAKLNITRTALYYYYRSKDDLFIEVARFEFERVEMDLHEAIASEKTTNSRFAAFFEYLILSRKKFRDIYKLDSDDYPFSYETHSKIKKLSTKIYVNLINWILSHDTRIGSIKKIDYHSTILVYSIRGIILNSTARSDKQLQTDLNNFCEVYTSGLAVKINQ